MPCSSPKGNCASSNLSAGPFIPANVDGGASVLTSFDRPSFLSFVRFVLPNKHGRASQWTLYYGSPHRVSPSAEKALDLLGFMVQNGCNAGGGTLPDTAEDWRQIVR